MNLTFLYIERMKEFRSTRKINWDKLMQFSYNVQREMAPIYTLGSINPEMIRGRRSVTGTMTFNLACSSTSEIAGLFYDGPKDISFDWRVNDRQVNIKLIGFEAINSDLELSDGPIYEVRYIAQDIVYREIVRGGNM